MAALKSDSFRAWPTTQKAGLRVSCRRRRRDGVSITQLEITTDGPLKAPLWILHRDGLKPAELDLVVLNVLDDNGLGGIPGDGGRRFSQGPATRGRHAEAGGLGGSQRHVRARRSGRWLTPRRAAPARRASPLADHASAGKSCGASSSSARRWRAARSGTSCKPAPRSASVAGLCQSAALDPSRGRRWPPTPSTPRSSCPR